MQIARVAGKVTPGVSASAAAIYRLPAAPQRTTVDGKVTSWKGQCGFQNVEPVLLGLHRAHATPRIRALGLP